MNKVLRFVLPAALLALAFAAPDGLLAQKKHDATVRAVSGVVSDADGTAVNGAVVQLKNTKTLQIRSFITKDQGQYYFQGLSPDVDFELHAEGKDAKSGTKTLSSFNSDKQAVINLKLNK